MQYLFRLHPDFQNPDFQSMIFLLFWGSFYLSESGSTDLSESRYINVRGASKIKLKKVNKQRMVTVRRLIIFLNISRHPLLICLHCCLHQYKTLKAVATVTAAIIVLTPAKNLNKVFGGFLVVSPLFNHFPGYV